MFPKTGFVLQYQRGIQVRCLVVAIAGNTPNFFKECPGVLQPQKPTILPLLRDVNHIITMLATKMDSNLQIFTFPDKYILRYEEAIVKWNVAGIVYPSTSYNPINMFLNLKPNREIRLWADLAPHNKIMVKGHEPIPN
jgi:hypothetical protein